MPDQEPQAEEAPRDRSAQRSPLERLLSIFARVEAGEGVDVVLMFLNVFLILNAYYILKTVREGLIIGGGGMLGLSGAELKIYSSGAMALLLLIIVPAYGTLASRVDRLRLLNYSLGGVIACLIAFYALGQLGVPLALPFFLWLGIVSVFLVAQFWSYANDIYSEAQGKRLFAVIAIGGSVGAIAGPKLAALGKEDTMALMLVASAIFGISIGLYNLIDRRQRKAARASADAIAASVAEKPLGKNGGFQLVFKERYLLLIALMLLLANLVNTTGEFILTATVEGHAHRAVPSDAFDHLDDAEARAGEIERARRAIGTEFYGNFYSVVNLLGFLIQAFLVSRIFKYLGVRVALFILPVVALGAYGAVGLAGGLAVLRVGKTLENSTDYSLQNTVRQALFLPTSREAKYKAKAAIDTFFVRFGDALAAAVVALGLHGLSLSPRTFAFANVLWLLLWLAVAVGIARGHRRLSSEREVDGETAEAA